MFKSIADDVKNSFRSGNMITRLILINCIVFVCVVLLKVFSFDWGASQVGSWYKTIVHDNLAISSSWYEVLTHPWTFFTHMFLHEGPWHIAFNMLWLYWFGRILGDLLGDKRILPLYIMGGFFGGILYLLTATLIGASANGIALGASGAVMAIVVAAAVTSPDYQMRLIFLGDVKLKYIAFVVLILDILGTTGGNSGGHFAHLGGAIFGYLFVVGLRSGYNLGQPVEYVQSLFENREEIFVRAKPKTKMKVAHRSKLVKSSKEEKLSSTNQERIDQILDKIKQQGMENLSDEEKDFLYKASKK